jgi:hypothetical protein
MITTTTILFLVRYFRKNKATLLTPKGVASMIAFAGLGSIGLFYVI